MKDKTKETHARRLKPSMTKEGQDNRNIYLAQKLAEKQLEEGTASSQVISLYLKLGSEKERLENEKLREENRLLKAKTESLTQAGDISKEIAEAIELFKTYSGASSDGSDIL